MKTKEANLTRTTYWTRCVKSWALYRIVLNALLYYCRTFLTGGIGKFHWLHITTEANIFAEICCQGFRKFLMVLECWGYICIVQPFCEELAFSATSNEDSEAVRLGTRIIGGFEQALGWLVAYRSVQTANPVLWIWLGFPRLLFGPVLHYLIVSLGAVRAEHDGSLVSVHHDKAASLLFNRYLVHSMFNSVFVGLSILLPNKWVPLVFGVIVGTIAKIHLQF